MLKMGIAIALISSCLFSQSSPSHLLSSRPIHATKFNTMNNFIDFKPIEIGYNPLTAGFQPEPKIVIFRNQQEWDKFWSGFSFLDINLNEQQFSVPPVNFEKNMVIGFTIGSRPTGGYSIRVERIEQLENPTPQWLLHYTEVIPGKNCIVTQQPTIPSIFILTENSQATIELEAQKITSSCSY